MFVERSSMVRHTHSKQRQVAASKRASERDQRERSHSLGSLLLSVALRASLALPSAADNIRPFKDGPEHTKLRSGFRAAGFEEGMGTPKVMYVDAATALAKGWVKQAEVLTIRERLRADAGLKWEDDKPEWWKSFGDKSKPFKEQFGVPPGFTGDEADDQFMLAVIMDGHHR